MTTKEAFTKLLESPDVIKGLDINPSTVRTLRQRLKEGKGISIEKMEDILIKAGAVKRPENWKLKTK